MKTEYDKLRDTKLQDPEFRAQYAFAKEKLNMDIMIESLRESVEQQLEKGIVIQRINQISDYLHQLSL